MNPTQAQQLAHLAYMPVVIREEAERVDRVFERRMQRYEVYSKQPETKEEYGS